MRREDVIGRLRRSIQNARRQFARDVSFLWAGRGIGFAAAFIQSVLVARALGPAGFGIATLVIALPTLIYGLVSVRTLDFGVKYLGAFDAQNDARSARALVKLSLAVDILTGLASFAVLAALGIWIAPDFDDGKSALPLLLIVGAAFVLRFPVGIARATLLTLNRFATISAIESGVSLFRFGIVVGLVLSGLGVTGYTIGFALAMVAESALFAGSAFIASREAWDGSWARTKISLLAPQRGELARFLVYSDLGSLFGVAAKKLDVIIVGIFRGVAEVGYYRIGLAVSASMANVVGPLQETAFQRLSRARGHGAQWRLSEMCRRYFFHISLPLALVCLVFVPLLPILIPLLYDESFAPAVPAAQLLLVASSIWLALFWVRPVLFVLDRVKWWTISSLFGAILAVSGYLVLTPIMGFVGTALSFLLAMILTQGSLLIVTLRLMRQIERDPTSQLQDDGETAVPETRT